MSVIRPATADDVPAILQMIHELAIYEKEPDAVHNTPEKLAEVLFGENPRVYATMAENDSFLHLARPLGPASMGTQPSTAPLNVAIQPQVCDKPRSRLPALLSDTIC